jgi:hypothetical protein
MRHFATRLVDHRAKRHVRGFQIRQPTSEWLRKQADLENQIMNDHGTSVATERELAATRRRLVAYPQALNALLQTARILRRTPDTVSLLEFRSG